MAHNLSSKKRIRQNLKRRLANRSQLATLRTQKKRFQAAIVARNIEVAEREYRLVAKLLDKAAKTHIVHKNAANRLKSRLAVHLNKTKIELAKK